MSKEMKYTLLPLNDPQASKVIHEFTIMREGWEMDNLGWITIDGRVFTTSHEGRPYEMTVEALNLLFINTKLSLEGLKTALTATQIRKGNYPILKE